MDAFEVHRRLIGDYRDFSEGFVSVHDQRIAELVAQESARGAQWPDPWLILELFDAMQTAIHTGVPYTSPIDPPPGHGPRHLARKEMT